VGVHREDFVRELISQLRGGRGVQTRRTLALQAHGLVWCYSQRLCRTGWSGQPGGGPRIEVGAGVGGVRVGYLPRTDPGMIDERLLHHVGRHPCGRVRPRAQPEVSGCFIGRVEVPAARCIDRVCVCERFCRHNTRARLQTRSW